MRFHGNKHSEPERLEQQVINGVFTFVCLRSSVSVEESLVLLPVAWTRCPQPVSSIRQKGSPGSVLPSCAPDAPAAAAATEGVRMDGGAEVCVCVYVCV